MTKQMTTTGAPFLPEGYVRPDRSKQFMKLSEGDNQFRILSTALLGWLLFSEDGPHRKPFEEPFSKEEVDEIKPKKNDDGSTQMPRHFWVMFVWCYKTKSIKVLEITQGSIMKGMETFLKDEDYGADPTKYDFVITREGTGKNDTSYTIRAKPPKAISKEATKAVEANQDKADLLALMNGEYPFSEYSFTE